MNRILLLCLGLLSLLPVALLVLILLPIVGRAEKPLPLPTSIGQPVLSH